MLKTVSWITLAGALALGACNNSTTPADTAGTETAMNDTAGTMPMDGAMSGETGGPADQTMMNPQGFVDAAAASDMFEIESSKLAQKMAKGAQVKEFAAMMIKDHNKSTADLKAAAGKASPAVTPAPKMTAMQQSDLDALKSATGNFDTLYAQKQVAAHQKTLAMLQGYANSGDVAALKEYASKTAPVVEGHLGQARKLKM